MKNAREVAHPARSRNGRLRLLLGEHDLVLSPEEAAEFDTSRPHASASADGKPVELLILFG
jgi:hypothetical protein